MANEQNLIPFDSNQNREEAKKNGAKGGRASGEARRRKKSIRENMKRILAMTPTADISNMGLDGIEDDELTNQLVMTAALMKRAQAGDVAAVKEIRSIIGDDERIKIERERLALERERLFPPKPEPKRYTGIPANLIAPAFSSVHFDIADSGHLEYVLPGGRGSTKSSFFGLEIVDLIMRTEDMHAVCLRQVGNTIKDSVYAKIMWAIGALGLDDEFEARVSPLEITKKATGQKIYFRGADDPGKIKSIAPEFGYIGILWFEELDQYAGPESVRNIEQSVIRGGDVAYIFKSFNPPKSALNWANKYIKIPRADRMTVESNYLSVPRKWLGKPFLDAAEYLKETNPAAYENEYLGIANGSGGNVFDNITVRDITPDEIGGFDRIYHGVDWGWYPDPWAYNRMHYDAARHTLYIFRELHANKISNEASAKLLLDDEIGDELVTCDSAEPKSIGDYKEFGVFARPAEKGPGSVDYSMKWLQSLREIVIDTSCTETAREFIEYEYERDKDGEIITGYPDKNNHHIDAVRYAMNPVWKRKGQ